MTEPQAADTSRISERVRWVVRVVVSVGFVGVLSVFIAFMTWMPGESHRGPLPEMTLTDHNIQQGLERHVHKLATEIGSRNVVDCQGEGLEQAAQYIAETWRAEGLEPKWENFNLPPTGTSHKYPSVANVYVELPGQRYPDEIFVVGAHYDTHFGSPGASDNASGVAAMLEMGIMLRGLKLDRTVRLVAFVNEELPYARTAMMGSIVHAERARRRGDNIIGMWSLETIGNYSDEPGSQHYTASFFGWIYPSEGNYIAFIGDLDSRPHVTAAIGAFRERAAFPSEGLVAPAWLAGVYRSDQWSFWKHGYPGIMITDTAPGRYDDYHRPSDTADKLEYDRIARLTHGLTLTLVSLVNDQ